MFKHLSILPVMALLAASACDGSEQITLPKNENETSTSKDSSTKAVDPENRGAASPDGSGAPNPSGEFESQLTSLVSQKAPWGDIEISVEKARMLRGAKPEGFPSSVKHSSSNVYAVLDLKLESNGDLENDYSARDTWDLMLRDGTRVKPLNPLGFVLSPGGSKGARLFYDVDDDAKLTGAALEINGSDRDALEPLSIPLDERSQFASQVELSDLVGKSFEPDDGSGLSFEILDAQYGVNLVDTGRRAPRDQRLVELKLRVGYDGEHDEISFSSAHDAPRLSIDNDARAPDPFDTRTITSGDTRDFVLVYPIDERASEIDLTLDGGQQELEGGIELPSLLERDSGSYDDQLDNADDDSSDEFDSWDGESGDEFDDEFAGSDDNDDSGSSCDEWGWCEDSSSDSSERCEDSSSDCEQSSWCDEDWDECSDDEG